MIYLPTAQPPFPVAEGSEEGSPPKESMKDNGHENGSEVIYLFYHLFMILMDGSLCTGNHDHYLISLLLSGV